MTLRDLDIDIDVDIDSRDIIQANDYADELVDTLRELDKLITIRVDFDDGNAVDELREMKILTKDLDGERIRISADIENITSDLATIHTQLEAIDRHSINIDIDTTGAHAQLTALQVHANIAGSNKKLGGGLSGVIPGLMGKFNPLGFIKLTATLASLMVLLPAFISVFNVLIGVIGTLGVAIGALVGGLLSFVSAIGIAAIGLGGFAALGISSITALYDENTVLTKAQKELKKQTDSVVKSWKDLTKTLQPFTFSAITNGVASVNTLLDRSEPILKNATSAVDGLFASFNKSLDSSAMQSFFSYLERSIGPITSNIGNGLGYALQGVLNTMTALEPLTSWVAQGFENMMGRFANWTEGLKDSEKMDSFINSTKTNLESIGGIIGGATKGIVGFFSAFGVTGKEGLDWFEQKMKDFATWAGGLDENEGFQEFLNTIKTDGPVIADIIKNIATNISSLASALSNLGRDEDGNSGILGWIKKLTDPENFNFDKIAENFSVSGILKGGFSLIKDGFNWSEIFDKFNPFKDMDFSWIKEKVGDLDWAKYISPLSWPSAIGNFVWDKFISKFNWPSLPGFAWLDFIGKFEWTKLPDFSWNSFISTFNWPNLETFSWSNFLNKFVWPLVPGFSWSNFIDKFNWPSLPMFSWASFIDKFNWIKLPSFSWSSFIDKFKWPSLPAFKWPEISMPSMPKISLPEFSMPKLGFSSGLGRVPNDMEAIIHRNEAILPAHQAETLREMGVIQGDGRYPTLNTSPLVSTTTVSTSNNGGGTRVEVGGVNIIVQGGNTNSETARVIADELDHRFAGWADVLTAEVEW